VITWNEVASERVALGGAGAVRGVRRFVRSVLAALGSRVDLGDVAVMVSEVATNAYRYSASGKPGGGVRVAVLGAAGRVRVEIQDDGGAVTVPAIPAEAGVRGRGLLLVQELSDAWGYRVDESGDRRVTVWFEVTS
jgi:anti-sigma regulatory factor (Ser/Thr protein kinase)